MMRNEGNSGPVWQATLPSQNWWILPASCTSSSWFCLPCNRASEQQQIPPTENRTRVYSVSVKCELFSFFPFFFSFFFPAWQSLALGTALHAQHNHSLTHQKQKEVWFLTLIFEFLISLAKMEEHSWTRGGVIILSSHFLVLYSHVLGKYVVNFVNFSACVTDSCPTRMHSLQVSKSRAPRALRLLFNGLN